MRLLRTASTCPKQLLQPNFVATCCCATSTAASTAGISSTAPPRLTVDHVIPVSRGGAPDRWENVVIACRKCNWRKANHRPEEVGLTLRRKPVPLTQEYAHIIFLRYPELKEAYDRLLAAA